MLVILVFDIKIDSAKYWRDCIDAIVNLVDEGAFHVQKDGISLKAMDPSGISMISFFIPGKAFSKFDVSSDIDVGLNIENLGKTMARARDDESLNMKASENKLSMIFTGKSSRKYRMPMIEVRKNADKEPNINFDATVEMNVDPFREIIKDASLLSSYISFKVSKGHFSIESRGDAGELEEEMEKEGDVVKKVSTSGSAEAVFNLEYLENMVKSCPSGTTLQLQLKTNEPLKLSYNIRDASFNYFLAPYISD
jgi:proliferating cell nuclear antigen